MDNGLELALGRYLRVMADELPARFLVAKRVPVKISENIDENWEEHEKGVARFEQLLKKISSLHELARMPKASPNLLDLKAKIADTLTEACIFCERRCRANRKAGKLGWCRVGYVSRVASAFEHLGEEPEFVPSGTIFFAGCNLACAFCQNWDIAFFPERGTVWSSRDYCGWIAKRRSAPGGFRIRNVNLVGGEPTPNLHTILRWLAECDINIPVIWNSNMFLSVEGMRLLHGVVDVFIDDIKYADDRCAMRLSKAPKYWDTVKRNNLMAINQAEILVRHLVMPAHLECDTKPIFDWIKANLGDRVRVNIMSQYHPEYKAFDFPDISRRLRPEEYAEAVDYAKKIGLWNIELQPMGFL
ncbi:MAG: radical SAM protein [Candidatus Micrarchaeia archaeon]